ncbi:MAG: anti-sigma factor antagonist [Planctomycetaceae bacterium]
MAHVIEVYEVGRTTVVGFGGREPLADINLAHCRNDLVKLVREHQTQILAFDLTGVRMLPSGLLGLLASMRREGIEVHIHNASIDVRDALRTTNLDRIMQVHEVATDDR